eukprot:Amastigsp_a175048_205.p2 type:complete len:114 gc:universal Amastigsp_a175048_205:838-497(-)
MEPMSALSPMRGSSGTRPRKRSPLSSARCSAPPSPKTFVTSLQHGQTKPDMFSITPRTRSPTSSQNDICRRTSASATFCGVETMTAPSGSQLCSICTTEMCSSEVPGGVSTTR